MQLPGCALCVTSVVHPGLWLNPTSSHFSRQRALSSVQQVSVTALGLRLGAEGLSLWWERDSGVWRDQTGCWRDQRVQIRETVESGCQLRPTCVCVCMWKSRPQQQLQGGSPRGSYVQEPAAGETGNPGQLLKQLSVSAQLLKGFTLQDHVSQQGTFCLNW